ncbi:hypothetical protein HU200_036674 [Digitaria exilis]|uniref:Uncharacterized protein n=1 Tax=Digitaria exilis TaxID=1010633 RepID=A0A835BQ99_9POAL|nr:hypothetical protein HU200_036674 [Digitaria exilis]
MGRSVSINFLYSSVAEGRKRKTHERRRLCSIPPTGLLSAIFWARVFNLFAKCLLVYIGLKLNLEIYNV